MRTPKVEVPRCGACDRAETQGEPMAICEACQEPACGQHLERVHQGGEPRYVCTVCAEELVSADPLLACYRERPMLAGAVL